MFPRLDCLGLIEAIIPSTCPCRVSSFRGLIASASLKRPKLEKERAAEAGFRGLIASASLKPTVHIAPDSCNNILTASSFRGLIASASLKLALFGESAGEYVDVSEA